MTKFNLDLKKQFIDLIESKGYSIRAAAKELCISASIGKRWWKMYHIHGIEGLSIKSGEYSGEFKVHVVKYMYEHHLSLSEASAIFSIPSVATLLKWESIYNAEGESGLLLNKRGRPPQNDMKNEKVLEDNLNNKTNEDLMLEVARLRAEVAYLKKSIALKEEKKSLQTKKSQR